MWGDPGRVTASKQTSERRAMSAILLPYPPELTAGTIEEIVAAAYALERAAAARYQNLGRAMRQVGHEDVARVFEDLAAEEQRHVASVERLSASLLSRVPTQDIVRWVLPDTFGPEEAGPTALLTPYKTLGIAVRSEERAFAFWTYVAAGATDATVRTQAETMAWQELLHAAKLRAARRRAYHAERAARRPAAPTGDRALSLEALGVERGRIDGEAAAYLSAAAARLADLGDSESAVLLRGVAGEIAALMRGVAPSLLGDIAPDVQARLHRAGRTEILFDATGVLERMVDRYVDLLDRSPDAAVTAELQRLGDLAMSYVSRLNQRFVAVEPELGALAFAAPSRPPAR